MALWEFKVQVADRARTAASHGPGGMLRGTGSFNLRLWWRARASGNAAGAQAATDTPGPGPGFSLCYCQAGNSGLKQAPSPPALSGTGTPGLRRMRGHHGRASSWYCHKPAPLISDTEFT